MYPSRPPVHVFECYENRGKAKTEIIECFSAIKLGHEADGIGQY